MRPPLQSRRTTEPTRPSLPQASEGNKTVNDQANYGPANITPKHMIHMQKTIGNQATLQLMKKGNGTSDPVIQRLQVPTNSMDFKGMLKEQYIAQAKALQEEGRSNKKVEKTVQNILKGKNKSEKGSESPEQVDEHPEAAEDVEGEESARGVEKFTTVGLEYEFAQFVEGELLEGISHLEIGQSHIEMPYSNLPFYLETDASRAIELVTPPFVVNTITDDVNIPDPAQVQHISMLIESVLGDMKEMPVGEIFDKLNKAGLSFDKTKTKFKLEPGHLSTIIPEKNYLQLQKQNWEVTLEQIMEMKLGAFTKGSDIKPQVNFATDAMTFHEMKKTADAEQAEESEKGLPDPFKAQMQDHKLQIVSVIESPIQSVLEPFLPKENESSEEKRVTKQQVAAYIDLLADSISHKILSPSLDKMKEYQELIYSGEIEQETPKKKRTIGESSPKFKKILDQAANVTSFVKDLSELWLKDNIANVTMGIFYPNTEVLSALGELFTNGGFVSALTKVTTAEPTSEKERKKAALEAKKKSITAVKEMQDMLQNNKEALGDTMRVALIEYGRTLNLLGESNQHKEFKIFHDGVKDDHVYKDDKRMLGIRHDTHIAADKVQGPVRDNEQILHVVEMRKDAIERLQKEKERRT
jgi:hypothetical protein